MNHVTDDPAPASLPPIETFSQITLRPLFAEARRPPKSVPTRPAPATVLAVAPLAPPERPVTFTLLGVIGENHHRIAYVRSSETSQTVAVHAGDAIANWKVADIEPSSILLLKGGDGQEIKFQANIAGYKIIRHIGSPSIFTRALKHQ